MNSRPSPSSQTRALLEGLVTLCALAGFLSPQASVDVWADEPVGQDKCRSIKDSTKRLKCYDSIGKRAEAVTAPTAEKDNARIPDRVKELVVKTLSTNLFDPYSATFTFDAVSITTFDADRGTVIGVVCGTINAKNRFGGYVGPQGFMVQIIDDKVVEATTNELRDSPYFWSRFLEKCRTLFH